jgi:hypothetical protein
MNSDFRKATVATSAAGRKEKGGAAGWQAV